MSNKDKSIWKDNTELPELYIGLIAVDSQDEFYTGHLSYGNKFSIDFAGYDDRIDWSKIKGWRYQKSFVETIASQSKRIDKLYIVLDNIKNIADRLNNLDDFDPISKARYAGDLINNEITKALKGE